MTQYFPESWGQRKGITKIINVRKRREKSGLLGSRGVDKKKHGDVNQLLRDTGLSKSSSERSARLLMTTKCCPRHSWSSAEICLRSVS